MITMNEITLEDIPEEDINTYNLLTTIPSLSYQKDEIRVALEAWNDIHIWDTIIKVLGEKYVSFCNEHIPDNITQITKNDLLKLLSLPVPEFYPLEDEIWTENESGQKFVKEYLVISKNVMQVAIKIEDDQKSV